MEQESEQTSHSVTLEKRKRMMVTGVLEVLSATDKSVIIRIKDSLIYTTGKNLRVAKLVLEEGLLVVDGEVEGFKYQAKMQGKSFLKRLFK
ncbi:MAG: hypothetical protein IJS74_03975 [Clostridia bacterium]|nr:hypothetical protein [Clostridia bacterium]